MRGAGRNARRGMGVEILRDPTLLVAVLELLT
jgi:hypothetical protein